MDKYIGLWHTNYEPKNRIHFGLFLMNIEKVNKTSDLVKIEGKIFDQFGKSIFSGNIDSKSSIWQFDKEYDRNNCSDISLHGKIRYQGIREKNEISGIYCGKNIDGSENRGEFYITDYDSLLNNNSKLIKNLISKEIELITQKIFNGRYI